MSLMLETMQKLVGQINPSGSKSENEQTNEDLRIDQPKEQGNQDHPQTSEPKTSESELSNSEKEEMDDENLENNHNDNQQPWILRDALVIPERQHGLAKHP